MKRMREDNMLNIKPLTEDNAIDIASLMLNAYPAIGYNRTPEQYVELLKENNNRDDVNEYGVYDHEQLVGGFNVWDFDMNVRNIMIQAAGIGSVAVDLCRKKEKIALHIMRHFIHSQRERGRNITLLYAFNSAFYHKMGYGFGTLLQQFRLRPTALPSEESKKYIIRLMEADASELVAYYNEKVTHTHGLIQKAEHEFATRLKNPAVKIYGYRRDGVISGYMACTFKKGSDESFLVNDLIVNEMFFDSPDVYIELMTFLKSQADQVRYVILNTFDEGLIHTITDPRNQTERILYSVYQEVCQSGLGIMYRITDVRGFFEDIRECRFGDLTMSVRLTVRDSIVEENHRSFGLRFDKGFCTVDDAGDMDMELVIDIAELSSLLMGCANVKQLVKYGKAHVSDVTRLEELSRGLYLDEKPVCVTHF